MKRCTAISCNVKKFISTASTKKSTENAFGLNEQKENYYKNLVENSVTGADVKPFGWDDALPYKSIPGPKPVPIAGNFWRFLPYVGDLHNIDVLDMHKRFYKEYGKIVLLRSLKVANDTIIIYSPEDFEMMHRNEGVYPIRDSLKTFSYYRTVVRKNIFKDVGGLATVHGKEWYNFRTVVNPILMQPRTALQYVSNMDHIAKDFIERIKDFTSSNVNGEMPEDFINHIYRWALESIAFIAIDKRLGCLDPNLKPDSEAQMIINSTLEMFYLFYKLEVLPSIWKYYSTKGWKRFVEVLDTMTNFFIKYIKEAEIQFETEKDKIREHEKSVLQRLLSINRKVALTMASDLLTAGVDTTGRTTGAILYYLAKNPEVQDKLRKEILQFLPKKDTPVTKDTLENSVYLKAVIKETTRLAPIAVGNFRKTVKDMVIGGYQVPKGTDILTSNLVLCHSDEYFPKAKEFIPDRWLRNNQGELSHKHVNPFVYLPFGFGPRSCIGKRLANLEMEILTAKIIRNFKLHWPHEDMKFVSLPLYGINQPLKLHIQELDE